MSKNFEQAYKELAQNESPDLWDRIEARLTSKSAPENTDTIKSNRTDTDENADKNKSILANSDAEKIVAESTDTKNRGIEITDIEIADTKSIDAKSIGTKKTEVTASGKIRIFAKKYLGVAAAVLCAAVILPAAVWLGRSGNKSFSGAATTEGIDTAQEMESAMDTAMPEDGAKMESAAAADAGAAWDSESTGAAADGANGADDRDAGTGAVEDSRAESAAETGGKAEAAMDDNAYFAEAAEEEEVSGAGAGTAQESLAVKQSDTEKRQDSGNEEAKIEDMDSAIKTEKVQLPEGTVLEGIVVKVVNSSDLVNGNGEGGETGSIYTVTVKEDASGRLPKDSQMEVFVSVDASFSMTAGETYAVDITYKGGEEYPTVSKGERVEKTGE